MAGRLSQPERGASRGSDVGVEAPAYLDRVSSWCHVAFRFQEHNLPLRRALMCKRAFRFAAWAIALAAFLHANVFAQEAYPTKPIKLTVPFPPAGGTDVLSRALAQSITTRTKWLFVIDNRPGAGGN